MSSPGLPDTDPTTTAHCEELRTHIRTLTTLLRNFGVQKSPSKQPQNILHFLRHFTTLLTLGDKNDDQAKKVIAVTGVINTPDQVSTLVVAQNPFRGSIVKTLSLELIEDTKRSLLEVVKGEPNVTLAKHIADVWTAFRAVDRHAPDYQFQIESLELFFLSRSYRKFLTRFKEDSKLCGDRRLYEVIADWQPTGTEIPTKWVAPPIWLLNFQGIPPIKSRMEGEQVQWEFSDSTKGAWSKVLAIILGKMNDGIEQVRLANMDGKAKKKATAMKNLNLWCRTLYYFVVWDAGVVKSLLTQTDIVAGITTMFMPARGSRPTDEDEDDIVELLQEPDETKGQQVFRYLKTVVAWHAAVNRLSRDPTIPELLKNLQISLVAVPPSPSTILTLSQISNAFFAQFADMMDHHEDIRHLLESHYVDKKGHFLDRFSGCVHAEAALMGLVNYYGTYPTDTGHGVVVENAQQVQNIVQPVADAGNAVIAVSKKCCWCCDWLGRNLEAQFKLPGTHGIMFPWDPPPVGVSVSVLKRLEAELWQELRGAVSRAIEASRYSRHSSADSSPEGMSAGEMFSDYVLKA